MANISFEEIQIRERERQIKETENKLKEIKEEQNELDTIVGKIIDILLEENAFKIQTSERVDYILKSVKLKLDNYLLWFD